MSPKKHLPAKRNRPAYLPGLHPALLPKLSSMTISQKKELLSRLKKNGKSVMEAAEVKEAKLGMKMSSKKILARVRFDSVMKEIERMKNQFSTLTKSDAKAIFGKDHELMHNFIELNRLRVNNPFHITIGSNHINAAERLLKIAKQNLAKALEEAKKARN
jgi:hypothetical protein